MKGKHSGLEAKILASLFLLLAVFTLASAVAFRYQQLKTIESQIAQDIASSSKVVGNVMRERRKETQNAVLLLSLDPRLPAMVRKGGGEDAEPYLQGRLEALPVDFIVLIDRSGAVLRHVEKGLSDFESESRRGLPVFLDPVYRMAAESGSALGLELCRADAVCVNAVSKIDEEGRTVGFLKVGYFIGDRFATDIKELTGSELIISRGGQTLARSNADLALSPEQRRRLPSAGAARPRTVRLGGRPFALQAEPLNDAMGKSLGVQIIGRDASRVYSVNRQAFILFLGMTAALVPLSFLLALWLARQFIRPINALMGGVERITAGQLGEKVDVRRRDEIGRLAEAFNDMSEAIRERDGELKARAEKLKSQQEQLIQSGKLAAIGELASGVAHEIGNPLSAISGYAQMLQRAAGLPEDLKRRCAEIEKESEFIERIIQELLDFARPSKNISEVIDLSEAAEDALGKAANHKAFKTVEVRRVVGLGAALVKANRQELVQVFLNLAINAAQAMPDGGALTVRIGADSTRQTAEASFEDEGGGISAEHLEKIFDPFFTTKPPGSGTGLGLAISYRIVEKWGGTIKVENAPGGGVRAALSFPLAEQERRSPQKGFSGD